jgi:hypothetical protein
MCRPFKDSPRAACSHDVPSAVLRHKPVNRLAIFWSPERSQMSIHEHPGFPPHRDLAAVQQSLEILGDTVEELVTKIEAFDTAAKAHTFWNRPARAYFDAHFRSLRRAMFAPLLPRSHRVTSSAQSAPLRRRWAPASRLGRALVRSHEAAGAPICR